MPHPGKVPWGRRFETRRGRRVNEWQGQALRRVRWEDIWPRGLERGFGPFFEGETVFEPGKERAEALKRTMAHVGRISSRTGMRSQVG